MLSVKRNFLVYAANERPVPRFFRQNCLLQVLKIPVHLGGLLLKIFYFTFGLLSHVISIIIVGNQ